MSERESPPALTVQDRLVASTLERAVDTAAAFGRAPEQFAGLGVIDALLRWNFGAGPDG